MSFKAIGQFTFLIFTLAVGTVLASDIQGSAVHPGKLKLLSDAPVVLAASMAPQVLTTAKSFNIDLGLLPDDLNADYWFAKDKAYHWGVSAFLTVVAYCAYTFVVKSKEPESSILSCAFALTIGLAKEDFDLNVKKSFFSLKDLGADCAGIATGFLVIAAGKKIF
jgi:uncharacterized protein YfiM (DUF2279 family)